MLGDQHRAIVAGLNSWVYNSGYVLTDNQYTMRNFGQWRSQDKELDRAVNILVC